MIYELEDIITRYARKSQRTFPLRSETLAWILSQLYHCEIDEKEIDVAFARIGIAPSDNGLYKMYFERDWHVMGLFDFYDSNLTSSTHLKCLINNAIKNPDHRMRHFCDYIIHCREMCVKDLNDDDVIEYLLWLARHTPSPKSTFAATVLYSLIKAESGLSPDQLQFVRENPELRLMYY